MNDTYMSQDEFTNLFKYMVERFDEAAADRDAIRADIDGIRSMLDDFLGKVDTDDQERLIISHQVSRHQDWIEKAGEKIGLTYKPSSL